ncbi:hypothetical protein A7K50_12710 [Dehalobacter sp. MCB1]|nr:hypothetical protein A7K50_12710 [Dehalobacter sp. MCB1]
MNTFESELRKLFDHDTVFANTRFVGRTCYGKLGDHIRVRAEFITLGYANKYEALKVPLLNRTEGVIDTTVVCQGHITGSKQKSLFALNKAYNNDKILPLTGNFKVLRQDIRL